MRRFVVAGTIALLLGGAASPAGAVTSRVSITNTGFRPPTLTIKTGDSVTWTNKSNKNHQVVSNSGAFASPVLAPQKSYTFTFRASGRYRYHDGLHPTLKGIVIVQGPPPSVSLAASFPSVTYGTPITLSGVVSSRKAGENVTVLGQPYPQASFVEVATVVTGSGGAWSFTTAPSILTAYQARYRGFFSQRVTVGVRPRVTLRYAHGYMSTRVTAATSFYHRFVYLQRLSRFGQWVNVRQLKLGPHSGRIFNAARRRGTYRVFLTVNQAGPGYLSSHSGTQRVRRR
jgi:plastocyanin